jgi:hypothetical protein
MATKEQVYKAQLMELGVYEKAFDPLIKDLSQAERQRTRAQKEWSEKARREAEEKGLDPGKAKPSFTDELWPVICDLDKKILAYREAMGLTPKSLRRLRGVPAAAAGPTAAESISAKLDRMLEREEPERVWSFEELAAGAGLPVVSEMDTKQQTPSTAEAVPLPQTPQAAGGGKTDG